MKGPGLHDKASYLEQGLQIRLALITAKRMTSSRSRSNIAPARNYNSDQGKTYEQAGNMLYSVSSREKIADALMENSSSEAYSKHQRRF